MDHPHFERRGAGAFISLTALLLLFMIPPFPSAGAAVFGMSNKRFFKKTLGLKSGRTMYSTEPPPWPIT